MCVKIQQFRAVVLSQSHMAKHDTYTVYELYIDNQTAHGMYTKPHGTKLGKLIDLRQKLFILYR